MPWTRDHLVCDPVTLMLGITEAYSKNLINAQIFSPELKVPIFTHIAQVLTGASKVLETKKRCEIWISFGRSEVFRPPQA